MNALNLLILTNPSIIFGENMNTVTLWILLVIADGHVPVVVDRFATEADCKRVSTFIEKKSTEKLMSQWILGVCAEAKVAR